MNPFRNFLFFLITSIFISCKSGSDPGKPNIILIMADDMGYEGLSSYGSLSYNTPFLDSLAKEGIRFTQCISQPLCTPSRVKIMTGLFNYRNYNRFGHLGNDEYTFGNLAKEAGYVTCIAGKWQLNGLAYKDTINDWNDSSRPYRFGFDEYSGLIAFNDFFPTIAEIIGKKVAVDGKSFYPLIAGEKHLPRKSVFVHYDPRWNNNTNRFRGQFARTTEYKLYADGRFYHVAKDKLEKSDLDADALKPQEKSVKQMLVKELNKHPTFQ
ncbi:MAG: sulfatase-like hydrolase/transferase [Cyclobacteriaceae bacterium]